MTTVMVASTDWASTGAELLPGGCVYVRCMLPLERAAAHRGWTVVYANEALADPKRGGRMIGRTFDGELVVDADLVVLQRWMHRDAREIIRAARKAGQHIINDIDDLFLEVSPENAGFYATAPDPAKAARKQARKGRRSKVVETALANPNPTAQTANRRHYLHAIQASTATIVSTPYLADRYQRVGAPNTTVLRNAIDFAHWSSQPAPWDHHFDHLRVGWHGSLGYRSGDLEVLRGVIGPWLAEHDAKLVHIGWQQQWADIATLLDVPPDRVDRCGAVNVLKVAGAYALFGADFGICPLAQNPFNRAKSAIKAMEMGAQGIPAACTDIDEYRWYSPELCTPNTPVGWRRLLDGLADPSARQHARERALERARAQDIAHRWTEWSDVITGILEGPP